ncbi:hypothetical protein MSG28_005504 [Choristoneura fumiferana]|uniref:Uncharacterized protein n=1 Tax=Choristoneura fumiferana TaxID=7141 RepID=A0ACC0KZN5_CHOFU|nr:hypothetical protein MSG28_005504 [Choristoneura fumiferana]
MQTKLHDTVCDKRNTATIAHTRLEEDSTRQPNIHKRSPRRPQAERRLAAPAYTGEQLFQQLTAEAEALRKEKKRNVYSGNTQILYLLEGKPKYPCCGLQQRVISFPPITNSESTKMSHESKSMLVEVTSHASLGACKTAMDRLLLDTLQLGLGDGDDDLANGYHSLTVQQIQRNLKSVYPSRTDCVYEALSNVKVFRLPKK